ncbi:MAG TPA: carboxypeptidase-like regulatory domain-containing protein [Chitinophagaceae bacterium]
MTLKSLLFVAMAVLISATALANTDPGNGENGAKKCDLLGGVYSSDTKKPIHKVTVTAYSANKKEKTAVTDSNGNYSFDSLKPGTYKFVFEKSGYKKQTHEKTITRVDEAYELNIKLQAQSSLDFMPGPSQFFDF